MKSDSGFPAAKILEILMTKREMLRGTNQLVGLLFVGPKEASGISSILPSLPSKAPQGALLVLFGTFPPSTPSTGQLSKGRQVRDSPRPVGLRALRKYQYTDPTTETQI